MIDTFRSCVKKSRKDKNLGPVYFAVIKTTATIENQTKVSIQGLGLTLTPMSTLAYNSTTKKQLDT